MSAGLDTFGQLSLFLVLAFFLPGLFYVGLVLLLLRGTAAELVQLSGLGGLDVLGWLAGFFVVAIGLTAVGLSFEHLVLRRFFGQSGPGGRKPDGGLLAHVDFGKISRLQVEGKDVSLLLQLAGQAVMHYNITFGSVLILAWALARHRAVLDPLDTLIAVGLVVANGLCTRHFFDVARRSVEEAHAAAGANAWRP